MNEHIIKRTNRNWTSILINLIINIASVRKKTAILGLKTAPTSSISTDNIAMYIILTRKQQIMKHGRKEKRIQTQPLQIMKSNRRIRLHSQVTKRFQEQSHLSQNRTLNGTTAESVLIPTYGSFSMHHIFKAN